jgi:muconolactone delta-isomerase
MSTDNLKILSSIDKEIESILNKMPSSAYEKVDVRKELPLFSYLPSSDYALLTEKVINLRDSIIDKYIAGSESSREEIRKKVGKYKNFSLVFVPNKDRLPEIVDKKTYLFRILVAVSIQNLNDDIRDLIIYLNELNRLSVQYKVDFDSLLKAIIPYSSNTPTLYSISMRDFFDNLLHKKSNPVNANEIS